MRTALEYLLRCALDEGQVIVARYLGSGVLISGIERDIAHCLHISAAGGACRKSEDSALGGVAADHLHVLALAGDHGQGVLMDRQGQNVLQLAAYLVKGLGFMQRAVDEGDRLQFALGDGTGLIGEQDIQGACGFDTCYFSYQDVVLEHFAHVLRGNYRDHQRKSLGDGHNDDDYCKHYGLDNRFKQGCPLKYALSEQKSLNSALAHEQCLCKHCDCNSDTADVAELAYAVSQLAKLELERSFAVVLDLELARDLAVNGFVADHRHFHNGVAGTYDASAENLVLVVEVKALVGVGPALGGGDLLCLAALAVQHGLIHLDVAVDDDTVRRDLVAGLEQDRVADNDVVDGNLRDLAVAVYLAHDPGSFLLELLECVLVSVLRECGNQRSQRDGNENTYRLVPLGGALLDDAYSAQYRQNHVDQQRHDEYLYHRVAEIPLELIKEALGSLLRHAVVAVFPA